MLRQNLPGAGFIRHSQSDEYILLCSRKSGDATTTETDDTQEHFISSYKQYRGGRKTMSMLVGAQN